MNHSCKSLEYVPTMSHFQVGEFRDLNKFLEKYLSSQIFRISDVSLDEIREEAALELLNSKKIQLIGKEDIDRIAEIKLLTKKILHLEPIEEKLALNSLPLREDLVESFSNRQMRSIICDLNLDYGDSVDSFFQERAELEVYRVVMHDPCKYDFFEIFRRDYEPWLKKLLPFIIPNVTRNFDVNCTQFSEKPLELEKMIDELSSLDFSEKIEQLALKIDEEAKPPCFSCLAYSDKKILNYSPKFTLEIRDRRSTDVIAIVILVLQINASCSSTFSDYKYSSSLKVGELVFQDDVPENLLRSCVRILHKDLCHRHQVLKDFIRGEKRKQEQFKKLKRQEGVLDLSSFSSHVSDSSKKKGILSPRLPSPRRLMPGSPVTRSLVSLKNRKPHLSQSSETMKKTHRSAVMLRKSSSKTSLKSFNDLPSHVDKLIPKIMEDLHSYQEKDIYSVLCRNLQGFEHLMVHPKFESSLNKQVKRVLSYQALSKELNEFTQCFLFYDTDTYDLTSVCSLPILEQLNDVHFRSKLYSENMSRQLLGKGYHKIPESDKLRCLLQAIFSMIYKSGFGDFKKRHSATEEDFEMIAELEARKLLCHKCSPPQKLIYPFLVGGDVKRAALKFSSLFPNLNQIDSDDHLNPSLSGEVQINRRFVKSKHSGVSPVLEAKFENDMFVLKYEHKIELFQHSKIRPFSQIVIVESLLRDKKMKWKRGFTIKSVSFARGTPLSLIEFVIHQLVRTAKECGHLKKKKTKLTRMLFS